MSFEKDYFKNRNSNLEIKHLREVRMFIRWADLSKEDKVFVHGCGYGQRLHWFLKRGIDAVGYEISKYARKNAFGLANGNIIDYFPDEEFDLLISYDVLEHIPQKDLIKDMEKIADLCNQAIYYITDLDNKNFPKDETHVNPKTKDEWIDFLKNYYNYVNNDYYYYCKNG